MSRPDAAVPLFEAPGNGLDADGILRAAEHILAVRADEQARLKRISDYMRGVHVPPYTPRGASSEYRWLTQRARDNFLPLVVKVIAQNLHVDGYRPTGHVEDETEGDPAAEPGWAAFTANRMVSRQHGIHRSVIEYGLAYMTVLPGRIAVTDAQAGGIADASMPVTTPYSPRLMTALYADDITDEWPVIAVAVHAMNDPAVPGRSRRIVTVLDDTNRYILTGTAGPGRAGLKLSWPDPGDPVLAGRPVVAAHGMGICPVIRFTYESDLDFDMDVTGEVEPLISLQDQVNFHTFNELLAEQFAAFRQRWVTGMTAEDPDGREKRPFRPGVDRVWNSEDTDTRFGEFSETNLAQIIESREATIRHMSTISQVPPYHLLGALINLSADALSAARDGLDRKVDQLRGILTDPWRNYYRLASRAQGDDEGWMDISGAVLWRDTSARSFAATVDGLGKAAQMLGVPAAELWRRIPGVTAEDVAAWKAAASRQDAMAAIDRVVEAALTGGQMTANPVPGGSEYQIGAVGKKAPMPPLTPAPNQPGAAPPGTPGNAAPDAGKSGEPPGAASPTPPANPAPARQVQVPAHTRSMPARGGGGPGGGG
ncbi:MAG: phage portal protein [Actinomycetia bacterium]|nr:phage portal protein [Actinomycetes bacterium]